MARREHISRRGVTMPPVHSGLRTRMDAELASFLTARRAELAAIDDGLGVVADTLESFVLRGGKRLRPAFAYWGYLGGGGEDRPELIAVIGSLGRLNPGRLITEDMWDAPDPRRA